MVNGLAGLEDTWIERGIWCEMRESESLLRLAYRGALPGVSSNIQYQYQVE
jgi:hypothetical protein